MFNFQKRIPNHCQNSPSDFSDSTVNMRSSINTLVGQKKKETVKTFDGLDFHVRLECVFTMGNTMLVCCVVNLNDGITLKARKPAHCITLFSLLVGCFLPQLIFLLFFYICNSICNTFALAFVWNF